MSVVCRIATYRVRTTIQPVASWEKEPSRAEIFETEYLLFDCCEEFSKSFGSHERILFCCSENRNYLSWLRREVI